MEENKAAYFLMYELRRVHYTAAEPGAENGIKMSRGDEHENPEPRGQMYEEEERRKLLSNAKI